MLHSEYLVDSDMKYGLAKILILPFYSGHCASFGRFKKILRAGYTVIFLQVCRIFLGKL
jgi:hypothetical protein